MADTLSFETEHDDAIRSQMDASGWIDEPVVAAGHLRQGKAPSMASMITGAALVEILRPRRSKLLPRHFVLVVTDTKVVAYKAAGFTTDEDGPYKIRVKSNVEGTFDRSGVRLSDLEEGPKSKGGTLELNGERIPVSRPNLNGDPSTDALLGVLAG